ncbi:MAG: Uma2 family endonuclease [Candidatus Tectomicrobia bacterium]|nr:Uma2 family endonuclease [Candidatus Tectomicrobia bacterium]
MTLEAAKVLTYEAYLAMPEMKQRYEIIDGELIMSPSPLPIHQWIAANLFRLLDADVRARQLGVVFFAPLDVVIHQTPLRTRQPDLLFLSAERSGILGAEQLQGLPLLAHAPDLVIEILSPANTRRELDAKIEDYQSIGVNECWIVSPEAHTVEVVQLSHDAIAPLDIFGHGTTVQSEVLADCNVTVEAIFS